MAATPTNANSEKATIAGSRDESQSIQAMPHHEKPPVTKLDDMPEVSSNQPDTESKDHAADNRAEIETISRDQFNASELKKTRALIKSLEADKKRREKSSKKDEKSIKDLGLRLGDTKQQLSDMSLALRASEEATTKIKKKLAASKQLSQHKKRESQKKLADLRRDLKSSQKVVDCLKANEKDLEDARFNLAAYQKECTALKDDLFRLQPIPQISDSEIRARFDSIGQQIIQWIDAEFVAFEALQPEAKPEQIFSTGADSDALVFMQRYPTAGQRLARYMIHRYLAKNVFLDEMGALGLSQGTAQILTSAEQSMARLEPPRDPATIAVWRSETAKALAATTECRKFREHKLRHMNDHLFNGLARTFPTLFNCQQISEHLYHRVTLPAGELAVAMMGSQSTYALSIPASPLAKHETLHLGDLERYNLVEITTGICLKPDSAVRANENGEIGEPILCLEPHLGRIDGNKRMMTLQPMTVLVKLFYVVGKRITRPLV